MSGYKTGLERGQIVLFPESLDDSIAEASRSRTT